jgi:hypothetical protein
LYPHPVVKGATWWFPCCAHRASTADTVPFSFVGETWLPERPLGLVFPPHMFAQRRIARLVERHQSPAAFAVAEGERPRSGWCACSTVRSSWLKNGLSLWDTAKPRLTATYKGSGLEREQLGIPPPSSLASQSPAPVQCFFDWANPLSSRHLRVDQTDPKRRDLGRDADRIFQGCAGVKGAGDAPSADL